VAAITDAVVLVSFMFVNASLCWLAGRHRTPSRGGRRIAETLIPSLALVLCAWLLLHAGLASLLAAVGLTLVLALLGSSSWIPHMGYRR